MLTERHGEGNRRIFTSFRSERAKEKGKRIYEKENSRRESKK
jgi:hypothetical protein